MRVQDIITTLAYLISLTKEIFDIAKEIFYIICRLRKKPNSQQTPVSTPTANNEDQ